MRRVEEVISCRAFSCMSFMSRSRENSSGSQLKAWTLGHHSFLKAQGKKVAAVTMDTPIPIAFILRPKLDFETTAFTKLDW